MAEYGKRGIRQMKNLLFQFKLQNFISGILTLAAVAIILFGAGNAARTGYMYQTYTGRADGHIETMEETDNPVLMKLEAKYPQLKKLYPVVRYDTENGKYIHRSNTSVKSSGNVQFSAQVLYDPSHADYAILNIEVFDRFARAGVLVFIGVLTLINARMLHAPNWKDAVGVTLESKEEA